MMSRMKSRPASATGVSPAVMLESPLRGDFAPAILRRNGARRLCAKSACGRQDARRPQIVAAGLDANCGDSFSGTYGTRLAALVASPRGGRQAAVAQGGRSGNLWTS